MAITGRTRAVLVGVHMLLNNASFSGGAVHNMDACDLVSAVQSLLHACMLVLVGALAASHPQLHTLECWHVCIW